MISRSDFLAYGRALRTLEEGADEAIRASFWGWCDSHPDATVEEIREFAIGLAESISGTYSDAGASLAAEWYDVEAEAEHAKLDTALLSTSVSEENIERVVHYQAAKLVEDDYAGFVSNLGAYARDRVRRSANDTIMLNCERDRRKGVRFARVPGGAETCAFCMMLSSRGFVYHTAATAGEQSHYHRGCDCKIVPGFDKDNPIEGYDPKECEQLWREFERVDGAYPKAQADAIKSAMLVESDRRRGIEASLTPSELADRLTVGEKSAWAEFKRKGKTEVAYHETEAAYFSEVGRALGCTFDAELMARPDGYEMWAAARVADGGEVLFRYATYEHKVPDAFIDGVLWEIKSPRSSSKTADLLVGARAKFEAFPDDAPRAIVSVSRLDKGTAGDVATVAGRFVDDGTFEEILVVTADEIVSTEK